MAMSSCQRGNQRAVRRLFNKLPRGGEGAKALHDLEPENGSYNSSAAPCHELPALLINMACVETHCIHAKAQVLAGNSVFTLQGRANRSNNPN